MEFFQWNERRIPEENTLGAGIGMIFPIVNKGEQHNPCI